jgi:hypothetical protein
LVALPLLVPEQLRRKVLLLHHRRQIILVPAIREHVGQEILQARALRQVQPSLLITRMFHNRTPLTLTSTTSASPTDDAMPRSFGAV